MDSAEIIAYADTIRSHHAQLERAQQLQRQQPQIAQMPAYQYGSNPFSSVDTSRSFYEAWDTRSTPQQRNWSKEEMKNIRSELVKGLKILRKMKGACSSGTVMVPNDTFIYEVSVRKAKPRGNYLIVPDDFLEIHGSIQIRSTTEETNREDAAPWSFEFTQLEDNNFELSMSDNGLTLTHKALIKDLAGILGKAGFIGDMLIHDSKAEKKEYEKKRAERREEVRARNPEVNRYDLRYATDDLMCNEERPLVLTKIARIA